jgi:hypothetical protein
LLFARAVLTGVILRAIMREGISENCSVMLTIEKTNGPSQFGLAGLGTQKKRAKMSEMERILDDKN